MMTTCGPASRPRTRNRGAFDSCGRPRGLCAILQARRRRVACCARGGRYRLGNLPLEHPHSKAGFHLKERRAIPAFMVVLAARKTLGIRELFAGPTLGHNSRLLWHDSYNRDAREGLSTARATRTRQIRAAPRPVSPKQQPKGIRFLQEINSRREGRCPGQDMATATDEYFPATNAFLRSLTEPEPAPRPPSMRSDRPRPAWTPPPRTRRSARRRTERSELSGLGEEAAKGQQAPKGQESQGADRVRRRRTRRWRPCQKPTLLEQTVAYTAPRRRHTSCASRSLGDVLPLQLEAPGGAVAGCFERAGWMCCVEDNRTSTRPHGKKRFQDALALPPSRREKTPIYSGRRSGAGRPTTTEREREMRRTPKERTLLWHAALHDDVQTAKVLLEHGDAHLILEPGLRPPACRRCSSRRSILGGTSGEVLVLRHGDGPRPALAPRTDRGCVAAVAARLLLPEDSPPPRRGRVRCLHYTVLLPPRSNKHTLHANILAGGAWQVASQYLNLHLTHRGALLAAQAAQVFRSISTVCPEPESPTTYTSAAPDPMPPTMKLGGHGAVLPKSIVLQPLDGLVGPSRRRSRARKKLRPRRIDSRCPRARPASAPRAAPCAPPVASATPPVPRTIGTFSDGRRGRPGLPHYRRGMRATSRRAAGAAPPATACLAFVGPRAPVGGPTRRDAEVHP